MRSEVLGVWLGLWQGEFQKISAVWLRFYDAEGSLIPMAAEAEAQRAEAEAQRANAAEAEAAALRARLRELEGGPPEA
jgi:hypothetical protein